ncbi:DNA repair and recombination protein RAD54B-like isoform X1 [Polistes fuscatus]|uniref:DNA repair and recombination protein RAD54B-like isoform X1 n=3 Tax=Polistes fuscatus TaxID=30207 RepID=UPI001CAA0ADD|nr:DNA repair and recombination protein RAD54B-like isoform X1 [Polistes fuscatus]XP_043495652.1 DNA repair and recombination protein RAD54B-like isoform X1 [Polistes fuscatus]XP_043495653.1 DNA repair and recombination protein RAD54B-like isoform X1 [Polistes fuscatus]XP_043495654.1 DNA repair and recombination protein RAD54B-like isoform X1 [Polistes fuscatus]XP_043495655.1 DNA repair and recombination protein RAD54B-like isoform X1 [Polistes fuscatus]
MSYKNNGLSVPVRSTAKVLSFFNRSKEIITENEVKNDSVISECDAELNTNSNKHLYVESNDKLRISKVLSSFNKSKQIITKNEVKNESMIPECDTELNTNKNKRPYAESNNKLIFNVVFGKVTTKKHKTWDNDGFLEVNGKNAILKDQDGSIVGRTTVNPQSLDEGFRLFMGGKEVEIISRISHDINLTDTCNSIEEKEPPKKKFKTSITGSSLIGISLKKNSELTSEALIMPTLSIKLDGTSDNINLENEQQVSVDACLTNVLRPHQRDGVIFLYECIMGIKVENSYGAILADEMGLGKTLQCITLIWTLLKKGPFGKPILKRVIIVTPSSLCSNWKKEFIHWLGSHRIFPFIADSKNKPLNFKKQPRSQVLIISYEMFVRSYEEIKDIKFDLIICDEGHRLKNSNIQAAKLLQEMDCKKRILLSGTPIQNDLQEFYTLVNFVNPVILGSSTEYKYYYEDPIIASQCPYASEDAQSLGKERAQELRDATSPFILRRTQEIISKYLPQKNEMVIFCHLSKRQKSLYSLVIDTWFDNTILPEKKVSPLTIITALKKICNHSDLFINDKDNFLNNNPIFLQLIKNDNSSNDNETEYCGKITLVRCLMRNIKKTNEKIVLVSYYTQTLDFLETICNAEGLKFCRLDGSTQNVSRMKIVEQFNSKTDDSKIFLLSAKAGGVGLNLPGASRLILFDSDWNPASDAQAMARIWRQGQKKNVYIYRLLMSGTIEEKIYQRQINKTNLSEIIVDANNLSSLKLSVNELKDLFTLTLNTDSLTHDLMNCTCGDQTNFNELSDESENTKLNTKENTKDITTKEQSQQNLTINQLLDWQHYRQPFSDVMMQELMLKQVSKHISFIFKNSITEKYDSTT